MTRLSARLLAACVALAPVALLAGQTPTVQVVPAELAGVVSDTAGSPMRDVDVLLPIVGKSTRTDAAGKFAITGVAPGPHEVWFRRIGYTSVQFVWTGIEGQRTEVAVTLHTLPNTLEPVTVWANETRSLSSTSMVAGVVVDSGGIPVAGAELQLIGAHRTTVSADDGTFAFRHVPPGTVTLRARRIGYSPTALMIELTNDDQRDVAIRIRRLDQMLDTVMINEASGYGRTDAAWQDFDKRERWRSNTGEAVIGPERLRQAGGMPIDWFIRPFLVDAGARPQMRIDPAHNGSQPPPPPDADQKDMACVLENGIQARYVPLSTYAASELMRIEYYPAAPPEKEYTGTVEARMRLFPPCAKQPNGSHAAYYVLWLKNAR